MRKFLSILLVFAMILSVFHVYAYAEETVQITGPIGLGDSYLRNARQALLAYVSTLPASSASAGTDQMLNHALNGKGRDLVLKETDPFFSTFLNANVVQTGIADSVATAIDCMLRSQDTDFLMNCAVKFYESRMRYWLARIDPYAEEVITIEPSIHKGWKFAPEDLNANDEAMILVVGSATIWVRVKKAATSLEEVTFCVSVSVQDDFDFDGDYSANNDSLASFLTNLGALLSIGVIAPYSWAMDFSFDVSVPNPCSHESANYRWEDSNGTLYAVTGTGLTANTAKRFDVEQEDGGTLPYYQLEDTVWLRHDCPWVIEIRCQGTGQLTFSQEYRSVRGTHLVKESGTAYGAVHRFNRVIDPETGETEVRISEHMYQIATRTNLHSEMRTYRFENWLAEDGTNEIHFLRDGEDLGALEHYHINYWNPEEGTSGNQNTVVSWTNGTDFLINYLFTMVNLKPETLDIEYIQIWENGETGEVYDHRTVTTVEPTHESEGSITTHCDRCGGTSVEILPETHDLKINPGYAPTCTESGLTDEAVCTTCGKTVQSHEVIPALGHTEKVTPGTVTCTEAGITSRIECAVCGLLMQDMVESGPLGHAWDEGVITQEPGCKVTGTKLFTCGNDPSHAYTEELPYQHVPVVVAGYPATCTASGLTDGTVCKACMNVVDPQQEIPTTPHTEVIVPEVPATCTKSGKTEGKYCSVCETVTQRQKIVFATGHSYEEGTCTACGEADPDWVEPAPEILRLAGENRFETAFFTADQMKQALNIEKFDAVVVASGMDFADALSGSYLAAVNNAPILLACQVESINDTVKTYIQENLNQGGTVYILGGENAVPASFETGLESFTVERLAGANRFETNLLVLEKAGVGDKTILVSTGVNFADSLSASAAKLPILLVYGEKLLPSQETFLEANRDKNLCILGGEGAVSVNLEVQLAGYGTVERLAGKTRFDTSVMIAAKFFNSPKSAVLAYAWNFPDGLCGGPLAAAMGAPLILTMEKYETQAADYIQGQQIKTGLILGGETLIPNSSVNTIFNVQ